MPGLGHHSQSRQKRRIIKILTVLASIGFIAYLAWPSSPQVPLRPVSPSATGNGSNLPYSGTLSVPSTIPNTPVTSTNGGTPAYSDTPAAGAIAGATGTPIDTGTPAATDTTGTTTTTDPPLPPPGTISYGAAVDPRFIQDASNPLKVTYSMSASASIVQDGQFLPVASLPAGTLELFSDVNGNVCSMPVGGTVVSGTCVTTYAAFGNHNLIANYVVGGSTYISTQLTDNVQPFSTTTVAGITGGGSLGGLVFYATVTDSNGNGVTAGSMALTVSDATQGWSYVVNGLVGPDGAHSLDFGCLVVENYPRVGEYSGCGLTGAFVVTPQSGDMLTETAVFSGVSGWNGSSAATVNYAMP